MNIIATLRRRSAIVWMAALSTLIVSAAYMSAESRDYLDLQVPGCQGTIPTSVNERGDVVGLATGCSGQTESFAFLYRDGSYQNIDVPGGTPGRTFATAINDREVVVGYFYTDDNDLRAFSLWRGRYTELDVAGFDLVPQGINNAGDVVGWIPSVPYETFVLTRHGEFSIVAAAPGLLGLQAWDINSSGVIVGTATHAGTYMPASFVMRRGELEVAGLAGLFHGINDRGDIAAEIPGAGYVVYRGGGPLQLNHPSPDYTVSGISNHWVVGTAGQIGPVSGYRLRLP
jgi:hypothetical protein